MVVNHILLLNWKLQKNASPNTQQIRAHHHQPLFTCSHLGMNTRFAAFAQLLLSSPRLHNRRCILKIPFDAKGEKLGKNNTGLLPSSLDKTNSNVINIVTDRNHLWDYYYYYNMFIDKSCQISVYLLFPQQSNREHEMWKWLYLHFMTLIQRFNVL